MDMGYFRNFRILSVIEKTLFAALHNQSKSEILFGKSRSRSKHEIITQHHPIVRLRP